MTCHQAVCELPSVKSVSYSQYGTLLWNSLSNKLRTAGLQKTASQRTMSGQNWVLTGQILGLPDILSCPLPTHSEKFSICRNDVAIAKV